MSNSSSSSSSPSSPKPPFAVEIVEVPVTAHAHTPSATAGFPGTPPWQTKEHFAMTIGGLLKAARDFLTPADRRGLLEETAAAVQSEYEDTLGTAGGGATERQTAGDLAESLRALLRRRTTERNEAVIITPFCAPASANRNLQPVA